MTLVNELTMYARFAWHLRGYLRQPPWTEETASRRIAAGLSNRAQRFLRVVREQAYDNRRSPYHRLLSWAGCEFGDLTKSVYDNGLERTLEQLQKAGVYITFDEFKGFVPIRRGSLEFEVWNADFDNCHGAPDFFVQTSGSSKLSAHVPEYLTDLAEQSTFWAVLRKGLNLQNHRMAIWYPLGGVSIRSLLSYRRTSKIEKWFSVTSPTLAGLPLRYRWSSRLLSIWCGILGSPLPVAEPGGLEYLDRVVDWCRSGGPTCVSALTSSAVRLCRRALERGLTLRDTCLILAGEPLGTEGRDVIEESGVTKVGLYAAAETGNIGLSCGAPGADIGDYHLRADRFAVIHDVGAQLSSDTRALLLTTLAPDSGKFLLNAQIGDAGTIHRRRCGCYLEDVGLEEHVSHISSLGKIVAEGMTLLKSRVAPILEEVLPAKLGGRAGDYQLVQKRDPDGIERLELWVTPEIDIKDDARVTRAFLDALIQLEAGMQVVVDVWSQARTVRVVRATPRPVSGKFPTIRIDAG